MAILKNKLVVILVVALLLSGGGAYYFLFMGDQSRAAEHKGTGEAHVSEEHGNEGDAHGDEEDEEDEEDEHSVGHGGGHGAKSPLLEPFVVNLADPGSRRYLRVNLKVKLRKPDESEPVLEARMPQVRDAVLMHLSSKTADQLLSAEGKTLLREELISEINKVLKKKKMKKVVKTLYFTEFLIQ